MANIFLVCHILLLFHSPKGSWNKSAKYEKLGKYWPYCTRNRAITNAYLSSFFTAMLWSGWGCYEIKVLQINQRVGRKAINPLTPGAGLFQYVWRFITEHQTLKSYYDQILAFWGEYATISSFQWRNGKFKIQVTLKLPIRHGISFLNFFRTIQ